MRLRMSDIRSSRPARYGFAVLAVLVGLAISLLFEPTLAQSRFVVFCGSVALAAWFGGWGPGILASILSIVGANYFFFSAGTFGLANADVPRFLIFSAVVFMISFLSEWQLRSKQQIRIQAKAALSRQEFLAQASKILSSSLDAETTMNQLAELAVPTLGDWCVVNLLDDRDKLKPLAIKHIDPEKIAWAWQLNRDRADIPPDASQGGYRVMSTGKSELVPEITDEMLVAAIKDQDDLRLIRGIGLSSSITVPLIARGRRIGTFALAATESRRHFTPGDLAFVEDIATRAALAISNAQLYEQTRNQREQLQVTLTSIGDAVIATNAQGSITFMNPIAEALTGWSQNEASKQPLAEVFKIVNEETRQSVESPVAKVMSDGQVAGLAN